MNSHDTPRPGPDAEKRTPWGFPGEAILAQDRRRRLETHVMHEIERERRPGTHWYRARPAWIAATATAIAVTGVVALGPVLAGDDAGRSFQAGSAGSLSLAQTVDAIALAAESNAPAPPLPGQFLYSESLEKYGEYKSVNGQPAGYTPGSPELHQVWSSPSGDRRWRVTSTDGVAAPGDSLALTGPAGFDVASYDFLAALPTDPDDLLAAIRVYADERGSGPDNQVIVTIADLMRQQVVPSAQAGALFRAAALLPGITLRAEATDATGRVGIALAHVDTTTGIRTEWIFDRATHAFLGERELTTREVGGVPANTVMSVTAVLKSAVVDSIPDGGTANPPAAAS